MLEVPGAWDVWKGELQRGESQLKRERGFIDSKAGEAESSKL